MVYSYRTSKLPPEYGFQDYSGVVRQHALHAGEENGKFDEVLRRYAVYCEKTEKILGKLKGMMIMATIRVIVAKGVVIGKSMEQKSQSCFSSGLASEIIVQCRRLIKDFPNNHRHHQIKGLNFVASVEFRQAILINSGFHPAHHYFWNLLEECRKVVELSS